MIYKTELKSFIMGGFECADHINRSGIRINLQKETYHDTRVFEDYKALNELGIKVVREGICWSQIEKSPYTYDFSSLLSFFEAAMTFDIQVIWDLCHFGYPDDLMPTHPTFSARFVSLCEHFTRFHLLNSPQIPWFVPINEISFLSWHSGDMRGTVPFAVHSGWDIKYHLCKAAILGSKAIKKISEKAVILAVEPLVKVHAAMHTDRDAIEIKRIHDLQYQAMDILLGRECPELGGDPSLVDYLGFNYYYNNQWTDHNEILAWPEMESRITPLSNLLIEVQKRYNYPLLLMETGHFGALRSLWLTETARECKKAMDMGVDLRGMCIYPIIDRPDWDDLHSFSNCGLWDFDPDGGRIPHEASIRTLKHIKDWFDKDLSTISQIYIEPIMPVEVESKALNRFTPIN